MQPAGGMVQAPMAPPPPSMEQQQQAPVPPQVMPQQWGVVPAPAPVHYQQAPPPPMWNQQPSQIPPPLPTQAPQMMMMPLQQQQQPQPQVVQYQQAPVAAPPQQPTAPGEVRTLWIGDLQPWMEEGYISQCFAHTGEVVSVKVIRNRHSGLSEGYGFIEFITRAAADRILQSYNGQLMPNVEQTFRMNWASAGERRVDDGPDYTIFVGDLASDVTDYLLQETFRSHYSSVKGAKVVTDRTTGRSKGYGFVKFGDANEQARAMTEMNGVFCSTRQMRVGPAANKKSMGTQQPYSTKASYQGAQGIQSENDPNNTTIFVGGLDPNVSQDALRQLFSSYGELVHVNIPLGKRCGFVQFANRHCAEEALLMLQGTQLGAQNIRLSWGRSPSSKQPQQDPNQWNGGYYGYGQGYEAYGYGQPAQDPNMYAYGAYTGYANYQQQQ